MDTADKNWFQFGEFRLEIEEKVLRRDGEIVPLQARVFEVLRIPSSKKAISHRVSTPSENSLTEMAGNP